MVESRLQSWQIFMLSQVYLALARERACAIRLFAIGIVSDFRYAGRHIAD